MSSYYTKEEKGEYERLRRIRVMEQARNYRLMESWLGKQHPDILTAHLTFKDELQRQNPTRLDLTTAPAFRRFMLEGNGTTQIPTKDKEGKTKQYGVPHSVHEAMRVALEKSKQDCAKWKAAVMGKKRRTISTSSSENSDKDKQKRRRTISTSSSTNSDKDGQKRRRTISTSSSENSDRDESSKENKSTGWGTKAETEAHIIAMMDLMSAPAFRKFRQKDKPNENSDKDEARSTGWGETVAEAETKEHENHIITTKLT